MTTISLVIPLHQGERFIAEAIGSVLAQEEPPDQLIVVDDGSTDRGPEIAAANQEVTLLRQKNLGPGAARNRGVAASTGELIAFLDQDDLLRPEALRRHRDALDGDPDAMISVGRQRFDLLEGEPRPPWQRSELLGQEIVTWTPSAVCVRRTLFDTIGPFDESLQATSDLLWFQRVRSSGVRAVELDETLVDRRVHAGCQSADASTIRKEMLAVFRRAAAAKREQGA